MKFNLTPLLLTSVIALSFSPIIFTGCEETAVPRTLTQGDHPGRLEIGFEEMVRNADFEVTVTPRSHGYIAEARGRGTIPAGEYAGQRFQIVMEANYSDIGMETLVSGEVVVTIRGNRFESVIDPNVESFCCGEGHLEIADGEYIFTLYGRVAHSSPGGPHQHLFAGLGTTAGTVNMNIADQTGTVVEQSTPPHDPGIGLIEDIEAQYVRVDLH